MPKRIALALLLALCCLCAPPALAEEDTLAITATFYPLYIATLNIARDVPGVAVACMAPPAAGCLHDYQLTTQDRRLLADSDVIVLNGAGLEGFLDRLLPTLGARQVVATQGMALLMEGDEVNAHVWVSPQGMIGQVQNIAAGLCEAYPQAAEQFSENADAYIAALEALAVEMAEALAPFAGARIVTFHEAFAYFARDFDLDIVATVTSHHEETPAARALADLADLIVREDVKALFAEPQYEDVSVSILARETGVPLYTLDPATSGPIDPPDLDAYLDIMRANTQTLVEALQ